MIENPLEKFRGRFGQLGLKVGLPSYVWPAGYAENVRRLEGIVDEVQLLAYEPPARSPVPEAELEELLALQANGPAYSLHLPVPSSLAEPGGTGEDDIRAAIEAFGRLNIGSYVLHVEKNGAFQPALAARRLERIIEATGVAPEKICVENLIGTPFAEVWNEMKGLGVSICFDAGHHLCEGKDPLAFMDAYGPHIRMAHLHGVDGRDHRPLRAIPAPRLSAILDGLRALEMPGAVIIENFSLEDMERSLECLAEYAGHARGATA